ncbi:MAG: hypothetical protein IJS37_00910 [Bacilli bacterium]|nr:hypothetical protein [Bacilli bacterium]
MLRKIDLLTESRFAPLILLFLFTGQIAFSFLLGCGLDRFQADGTSVFFVGGFGCILFLFLSLTIIPIYSKNYKLTRVGRVSFSSTVIFVVAICLALILCFGIFRPIAYLFPKSWASLAGWGPLVSVAIAVFLDCVFYFAGRSRTKAIPRTIEVETQNSTSVLQTALIRFAPFFFVIYLILVLAPYYTSQIPIIGTLLTSRYPKIAYRALTTAFLFAYSITIAFAFKKPLNIGWALPLTITLIAYVLAWVFLPNGYSYVSVGKMGFVTLSTVYIDFSSMIISFFLYAAEIAVFLCGVSWLPYVVRSRKTIITFFAFFVGFVSFACAFSIIYENQLYFSAFSGTGTKSIASFFHHKNEFGAMLFLGSLSSVFLFHYARGKLRFAFLGATILFFLLSIPVRCYTGLVPVLFLDGAALIYDLASLFKRKKTVFFLVMGGVLGGLIAVVVLTFNEAARNAIPFFGSVYNNLLAAEREILSRTDVWNTSYRLITGPSVFIGKTDPVANRELTSYLDMTSILSLNDYHSAFVSFYTNHGIVGLFIYVLLLIWVFRNCLRVKKSNSRLAALLIILLSAAVLFSMPESYTLFVNMSGIAFPTLCLFVIFTPYLDQEGAICAKDAR